MDEKQKTYTVAVRNAQEIDGFTQYVIEADHLEIGANGLILRMGNERRVVAQFPDYAWVMEGVEKDGE